METMELMLPEIATTGNLSTMQLPEIGDYNFWQLYNNRILTIEESITEWDYHIVKDILKINMEDFGKPKEERKPIIILINSYGGMLDIANSIIDAIKISTTPVWTVNMGNALSGGCVVFLAGERRFCTENSWAMAHSGSGGISGGYNESKEAQKVWDTQVKRMHDFIKARIGMDTKTYSKYKNKDWYVDADQQIDFGFATEKLESIDQILRVD